MNDDETPNYDLTPRKSISRSEQLRTLRRENADLRRQLEITPSSAYVENAWERVAAPEIRDDMAARALIGEWGNVFNALIRLGYDRKSLFEMGTEEREALATRIFETEGVRVLLSKNLSDVASNRERILARQAQIAMYGGDSESVRAASQLAKIMGWAVETKTPPPAVVNLYTMVGAGVGGREGIRNARVAADVAGEALSSDPLALLAHDPGAPVRIDSGDDAIADALDQ